MVSLGERVCYGSSGCYVYIQVTVGRVDKIDGLDPMVKDREENSITCFFNN